MRLNPWATLWFLAALALVAFTVGALYQIQPLH